MSGERTPKGRLARAMPLPGCRHTRRRARPGAGKPTLPRRTAAEERGTSCRRPLAVLHVLPEEACDEARVVAGVAAPKAMRFLRHTEEPLHADPLYRVRSLRYQPGVKVEGRADAHEDGRR